MANCTSCSAPLPADTGRCGYCGTRNDLDVGAVNRFAVSQAVSPRHCPHCAIAMQTVTLAADGAFAIERCEQCFGLFFDPGELQAFLAAAVAPVFEINRRQILNIGEERGGNRPVRYVKCPACAKFMNRVNFGYLSGVVMDQCKAHGVWLDNGELVQLLEWKKAGGQMLADEKERQRQQARAGGQAAPTAPAGLFPDDADAAADPVDELLSSAVEWLARWFR